MKVLPVTPCSMRGTTLLEVVIALVLLGLVTGIGVLNLRTRDQGEPTGLALGHCRVQAVRTGRPQPLVMDTLSLLCLPDGGVAGAGPDQLVGRVR